MITEATPKNPRVVYVNKAFTDLTGYSTEEVLGKSPSFSCKVPEPMHPFCNGCTRIWRPGSVFEGKAVNYRKDGSAFTMVVGASFR